MSVTMSKLDSHWEWLSVCMYKLLKDYVRVLQWRNVLVGEKYVRFQQKYHFTLGMRCIVTSLRYVISQKGSKRVSVQSAWACPKICCW